MNRPGSRRPSDKSSLWKESDDEFTTRRVAMEVYGDTDTGRSTLALTAPGPIAYLHAFEKVDGLMQKFKRQGKTIREHEFGGVFRGSADDVQAAATVSVDRFEAALSDAYSWARTIIIDTHTELWQVYQLARLGSLTRDGRSDRDNKMGQLVYTEINNRWLSMLKEYRVQDKDKKPQTNLIIIGQTSAEYKKNKVTGQSSATGDTIRAGQKNTGYFCDVIVRTRYNKKVETYTATVEKPWWNSDMRGLELEDSTFQQIMSYITETEEKEWL